MKQRSTPWPSGSGRTMPSPPEAGTRRQPELASTAGFGRYQRAWFAEVRERAAAGEPVAIVSADAPHELYRALDIPYIVVQWWSSVVAAKQLAPVYLASLAAAGYPDDHDQYSALPLAEALDPALEAPWGGLPRPTILSASIATDGMRKLYEAWASATGAVLFPLERTVDTRSRIPTAWWAELPRRWDSFLPTERLDLLTDELRRLITGLEAVTGRRLDHDRLAEVMELANEHAEHNVVTRDLVARTVPAPVSAAETMAATMIPQWHRGSVWGRDAAAAVRAEVAARVANGVAASPGERIRLMWLGRGLWSSLGFYQYFAREYGAVFVWSMYLGLAADGYLRYVDGRDPLRALASRFVPMGEELRMPTWSSAWHLKEAQFHQVDGVVSLGEDDFFSVRKLESAGIPVLSVRADNVDRRTWDEEGLKGRVGEFIERRVVPVAEKRRAFPHGTT